ncbi:MAG: hypothetical protein K0U54_12960 [Bacteroidetes bacterium]|nr:hypothetical protein [Bacteroidota bacterium]
MKKRTAISILEWALRINVFIKLFIYGTGKIMGGQFYLKGEIPEAIGNISLAETGSYNLAWTFFGHSQGYIFFIGISQLIGASLLLFNKTKIIGGAILFPILLNIIVVDYFFGVARGALFGACFYLASLLFMMYLERAAIVQAFQNLLVKKVFQEKNTKRWIRIMFIAIIAAAIFALEYLGTSFFGYDDIK